MITRSPRSSKLEKATKKYVSTNSSKEEMQFSSIENEYHGESPKRESDPSMTIMLTVGESSILRLRARTLLRISDNVSLSEHPIYEIPGVQTKLRHILLLPESARCEADYKFLDNYVQRVKFFRELPFEDRLKFLRAAKGIELGNGEVLFRIGDRADTFYCIMFGTMSVVMDFSRMAAPTLNEFEEIMNRARVQSSFLNPGGRLNLSHDATYVVRTITSTRCLAMLACC
ncbi:RmlC-like jelly roll fold [Plasmopara halstedii]|uniref:RmlC-like jelly roll fold n=1 Tax=Plasmopara halstedii TaxID=4781 RepID=A0A0P1B2E4_PLAHL|nr:RmlC-like jelly roll fold [Plasmopara halstedii]CEG48890.1 RmlC-like jelly roll fold [Plasmopara halstedii]|eukprot:XP_024585259.1 RmlC-like jelly roll fold [Plasmopara halstedii]